MSDTRPKKSANGKSPEPKAAGVKPVPYDEFVKDKPEPEIDLAKAYDWTKHYSYDPAGNTYIRSLPEGAESDPDDVKPIYIVRCPKCDTEIDYNNYSTIIDVVDEKSSGFIYNCPNCGKEFKV